MIKDEILRLWRQRPFQPFRIITVVGEAIDVSSPRLMLVAGNMLTIGQPYPGEPPPAASDATWLEFRNIERVVIHRIRRAMPYKFPTPGEIPF